MTKLFFIPALLISTCALAKKDYAIVNMDHLEKKGSVGTITLQDSEHGLFITPNLEKLEPGVRGFHVHEHGDCSEKDGLPAGSAGGHYDPDKTGMHLGPYSKEGHRGDLPPLFVDEKGVAATPTLAPHLTVNEIRGRALVVHKEGDNLTDTPRKSGGGGDRQLCGVIPK